MIVYVALGSNLGDRLAMVAGALVRIEMLPETVMLGVSHVYESEPWGTPGGPAGQLPYANAVAAIETPLPLDELLDALKDIERELGREPSARNAPRPIDLDILLAGEEEWQRDDLTVPHPRMAERDFVITPLLELDPDARWPDGSPVTRDRVRVGRVLGVLGLVPGFEDRTPAEEAAPGVPGATGRDEAGAPAATSSRVTRQRRPLPGEEWAPAFEYGQDPLPLTGPAAVGPHGAGAVTPLSAARPSIDGGLAQLVLEQAGIPYVWDPFPPGAGTDPYGFGRRLRLMVPASMAQEARRLIDEVSRAPFEGGAEGFFGR